MVAVLGVGGEDPVHDDVQVAVDGVGELGHRLDVRWQGLEGGVEHDREHASASGLLVVEELELGVVGELGMIRVGVSVGRQSFTLVEHDVEDGIGTGNAVDHDQTSR